MTAAAGDAGSAILDAWERGDSTSSMRTLVESSAPSNRARIGGGGDDRRVEGPLGGEIEHFERCDGRACACGHSTTSTRTAASCRTCTSYSGLRGWASASGAMKPSLGGDASVTLVFDDLVGADAPRPRAAPDETDPFDTFSRLLGRAAFFEGLASFPVDYADLKKDVVAFRFTAFDSMIVTRRAPAGATPERVQGA